MKDEIPYEFCTKFRVKIWKSDYSKRKPWSWRIEGYGSYNKSPADSQWYRLYESFMKAGVSVSGIAKTPDQARFEGLMNLHRQKVLSMPELLIEDMMPSAYFEA